MIWLVHRLLDLRGGDGHVFQLAENIQQLHSDKLDLFVLYQTDDVFIGVTHAERSFSPPAGGPLWDLMKKVWHFRGASVKRRLSFLSRFPGKAGHFRRFFITFVRTPMIFWPVRREL